MTNANGASQANSLANPLVSALTLPEAYPHDASSIRLVETHVSWIFFAGDYVYKVKKPVDFGFLDFTSMDKRRMFCRREVELNSHLSPDVYLGVVEIHLLDGAYSIEGQGEVVEHAVKMRRLPDDRVLNELLARNKVSVEDIRQVAARIAEFHRDAPAVPETRCTAQSSALEHRVEENFQQTERFVGRYLSRDEYDDIVAYSRAFLKVNKPFLEARAHDGRIREGHGDLHAANIFIDDGVQIIDAIEFNDRFRILDVTEDVAFLAMDLDCHERIDLSRALIDAYVEISEDPDILSLLNFFKCYRAYVRAKVNLLRLDDPQISGRERSQALITANTYFHLAHSYIQVMPVPTMTLVGGLMGTGKTTLSAELARRWDLKHISSDVTRKRLAGEPLTEHKNEPYGQGLYSEASSAATYSAMLREASETMSQGCSVILDASFLRQSDREQAFDVGREAGAAVWFVECVASEDVAIRRLALRASDDQAVSDGRLELMAQQKSDWESTSAIPESLRVILDTSGNLEDVVSDLLETLNMKVLEGCLNVPSS
ncbi:MAG: AAA family ATPase [SAR202 cluster bacterium]|nr:AAA family ATPase [SAR202 cluster bacterium]MDP6514112.1 AAA family ATPase [SAR202 cluster bacterium]MDP6714688.1 AAA family ATPase [SAR202 cluster bacterium]